MTRINLLPWRETLRTERQKSFFIAMGSASAAMILIILAIHLFVGSQIEYQNKRNSFIKIEIDKVDLKIRKIKDIENEKSRLLARMHIIQQLQTQRPEIVHIFQELVKRLPEGIYLTSAEEEAGSLVLSGIAQSNARISAFMRQLDLSDWFKSPRLEVIQADENDAVRTSRFKLAVRIVKQEPVFSRTGKLDHEYRFFPR